MQEWADALSTTAYVPMSGNEIQEYLADLVERLVAALAGPAVDTQVASEVGARLVTANFTGKQSLPRTVEVLARTLPVAAANAAVELPCGRLIELLNAVSSGYSWALRDHVFDQQENVAQALLRARHNADSHLLKEWLGHQALHDVQTGLPNRQYLISHLERVLGLLEPSAVVTLLHLNLDGFSAINDGLGRRFGDQMLELVAQRLRKVVAEYPAMVARIGGDEYAILIEPSEPPPDVASLAEAINTELAEPVYLQGTGMAVTATIGVVQRQGPGMEPAEMLRAASTTLRSLRSRGKRQWGLFDAESDAVTHEDLRLAAALPGALETGELQVTYQPVTTLEDGRLRGVEAVLGWRHPQFGVLSHERCVQAAEQTGVVYALGEWMLRVAAEQAVCWQLPRSGQVPPVVINLTLLQAQDPDLVAKVTAALDETGLPPAALELRLPVAAIRTANGLSAGAGGAEAEDNLKVLAELGVRAGLHDFGGGIGGLRCLADLPVSVVRVCEPVSQQVADDPSRILSQAVHALVHIVRAAGIDVIAFPVDSSEQAACWRWVGANWAVGALCGQPGPPENIERLLDA
ncbi:MAG: putative bifunctional diguanylate cyclase/phosphodiesterase [Pseudonocardiaceae bacterium]